MLLVEASIFVFLAGVVFAKHHHNRTTDNVPATTDAAKQESTNSEKVTNPASTVTGDGGEGCQDQFSDCPFWEGEGECIANPPFMMVNCAASCGNCSPMQTTSFSPCEDQNRNCAQWSSSGKCIWFKDYMVWKCPKACSFCMSNGTNPQP